MNKIKEILKFSFFILLGHLGQMAFNFTDLFICSHYSSIASGALSVANGIFAPFLVVGLGLTIVVSSLVSFHRSKDSKEHLSEEYLVTYMICSLGLSLILFLLLTAIVFFVPRLGIDKELLPGVVDFLLITANSLIPAILFSCLKEFLQGHEKTLVPNILIITFNIVNFILGSMLVKGLGPFSEMGLKGTAWATVLCRWPMFILLLIHMHYSFFKGHPLKNYFKFKKDLAKEMLKMGIPLSGNILLEVGVFSTTTILSSSLGVIPAASHGIVLNLISVAFMFPLSISSAASVKIAYENGQKNYVAAKETIMSSLIVVFLIMGLLTGLFIMIPKQVVFLLTSDSSVIIQGAKILAIAGIFQIADGLQVTSSGLLRGLGETRFPMYFYIINYWFIGLPLGYFLGITKQMGIEGLWAGLALAVFLMALTNGPFLMYFFKNIAKKKRQEN